ncbi:MAG: M15 family metallopeptidase [Acidimicrobiia bacterium]
MRALRGPLALLVAGVLFSVGTVVVPAAARSDTVPSFSESPGCGAVNGVRGPHMGPGPYDPAFPYDVLPDGTELHGPWADYYGRTIGEVGSDLVPVNLPGLAKTLYIHQRVLPAFQQVLDNLAIEAANGNVYDIRDDTWSYNPATIPPGRHLSFHGVGAAIDVNSTTNPYRGDNVLITDMPTWFVDAWRDAGWCWGGDWISIKDPMHFAWMGPIHTPGYGPDPAPYPADTAASSFDTSVALPNALNVTIPTQAHIATDIDRDGSPDVVRFQQSFSTGEFIIEAAIAKNRFEMCTASNWAPAPAGQVDSVLMVDYTRNGRPEVWLLDESGPTVVARIYNITSTVGGGTTITGTPQLVDTVTTAVPAGAGAHYLLADHDRDTDVDLYAVTPGAATRLEVWEGPTFTTKLVDVTIGLATDTDWRFSLGDHDLDVVPDLYALSPAAPATLQVVHGAAGFSGAPTGTATAITPAGDEILAVEDYDGDGRDDVYLVGSDGDLRVILGGDRAAGADLDNWFVERDLTWGYGSGCRRPALLRVETSPAVASQILVDGVPFDTWGLTWVKLPPGTYEVSFSDVEGFTTPAAQTVAVGEGATTTVTGSFTERGFLRVFTDPAVPGTITVDGIPRNDWGMWTDLPPGDHEVCFGDVADYTTPPCETATVIANATTNVTGTYVSSAGAPGAAGYGMLRATTNPPAPSQIIVDGVPRDSWGLNWLKLPPGDYEVAFTDVEGFATPASQTVTIVDGLTTEVTGNFTQRGWLQVFTSPPVSATVFIDGIPRNDWGMWTDLPPGDHEICFGDVAGYTAPACSSATVTAGSTTSITGIFG